MNTQSTSGRGHRLDKTTKYWSISNGRGLPQMFWDWWEKNLDTKFHTTYSNHAHDEHADEFNGVLKSDKWIVDDFFTGNYSTEVFECHYDMTDTLRPRKFVMNLPFYNKQNDSINWHPIYNYTAVFAANNPDPNHLEVSTVWKREEGQRGHPSQRGKYEKGVGTPTKFMC